MLLKVRELYPEAHTVTTENANSNAPMRSINERLGFVKHKSNASAQMKVEEIEKLLQKKDLLVTT